MMMMVTVRRRVVCDLLILALLCCCCCLSVCGTAVPAKSLVFVHFSCPGTDGKLSWHLRGEEEWKKCPKKPEEVDQDSDERARLCVAGGDFYEYWKSRRRIFCAPPSDQVEFMFEIKFATYGGLRNSSSAMAQNNDREATDGAQRLQSQPQTGTAAPAATAAASTKAVVDQAQSGVGSPSREAAEAPQKKSPDHTAEDGSAPSSSENIAASPLTSAEGAVQSRQRDDGSVVDERVQRKGESPGNVQDASPLGGVANEHVASAPEASGRPSSSPSGDGAANETSHNSNEGDSESDASGEGNSTVAGTNPLRPTRDESANESTEDIAALLQNFVVLDGSDVTTVWVRTPLLLLVIALVCAAVR
ncbi:mucin-like glycoprotein [Trypanosoma cruzi]|uniref:Mucin-like glycoprotein, putative n=1 Tax=Trypanosoma cruzi (strain CL Brener) TaxID=353153 RepID=Q4CNF0_TRYCC|nr:mucin-like glycoprotein, putative [Trypanosoma cruzi]EAN81802.1 mucin-like glycoprotein, putative [Trypanosoma cruzi]RNC39990.1 mucin-like glycoprotein [Trypanosoma cruzi]|eukprot:XP_803248.1 mucin-like glycoprotein [Trypanosoma cruzi strain CL Brener]